MRKRTDSDRNEEDQNGQNKKFKIDSTTYDHEKPRTTSPTRLGDRQENINLAFYSTSNCHMSDNESVIDMGNLDPRQKYTSGYVPKKDSDCVGEYQEEYRRGISEFERLKMDENDSQKSNRYTPPEDILPSTSTSPTFCQLREQAEIPAVNNFRNTMRRQTVSSKTAKRTYTPGKQETRPVAVGPKNFSCPITRLQMKKLETLPAWKALMTKYEDLDKLCSTIEINWPTLRFLTHFPLSGANAIIEDLIKDSNDREQEDVISTSHLPIVSAPNSASNIPTRDLIWSALISGLLFILFRVYLYVRDHSKV